MSKKMTPCEKLGYKVGDEFEVISHHAFKKGQVVTLHKDDGTECPLFAGDGGGAGVFDGVECSFATLNKQVRKIANKLKPAKQALADAIHKNGGWRSGANWACQHGLNRMVVFSASGLAPTRNAARGMACWNSGAIFFGGFQFDRKLPNWHQCVLSRDEYFAAYPEQLKVEINNETEQNVEVEMKSESEMTIKVSDWHTNGELPPVGDVCIFDPGDGAENYNHEELEAVGCDVEIIAHTKFNRAVGCVAVFKWDRDSGCGVSTGCASVFRPIRTERDKAIEDMLLVIHEARHPHESLTDACQMLYAAGYRKEVRQ